MFVCSDLHFHVKSPTAIFQAYIQKMGFRDFLKSTVMRMDLTCTAPTFRVFGQPVFETIFGGIFSFLVMSFFLYILYFELNRMFNSMDIVYTSGTVENIDSSTDITDVMLAVSVEGVNLGATPKKFIIELLQTSIDASSGSGTPTTTRTSVPLSPCTASDWSSLGDDFSTQFSILGFNQMLCIDSGSSITLSGYEGSTIYKFASLIIHSCDTALDASCDTPSNINSYMTSYQTSNDYFQVKFYLIDTILTPSNTIAVTKFLEKKIFMSFTTTMGSVGHVDMGEWTLKTDNSVWPTSSYESETGSYIQSYHTNAVSLHSTKYVKMNLYKSTRSLTVTRTLGKFDTVLSYVGGLFGLLFTAIAFFFGSYSTYRYELYVAESMLSLNKKGKHIKQSDLSLFTFFAYCAYDWMDAFGCAPSCFSHLRNIHDSRNQACQQLDPTIMLKRIKYLEDANKVLMNEHRQLCLHLSGPLSLQQARRMRQLLTYYDRTLKDLPIQEEEEQIEDKIVEPGEGVESKKKYFEQEENEMGEDEEEEFLEALMQEAMNKLDEDKTQIGLKIKEKMTSKVKGEIRESQFRHNHGIKSKIVVANYSETSSMNVGDNSAKGFEGFGRSKKVSPQSKN